MKIATWNVNSLNVRLPHVIDWLTQQASNASPIDVLCLQELKLSDEKFPVDALREIGYEAYFHGQKTYNGVAILVRQPLPQATQVAIKNNPLSADTQARLISLDFDDFRLINGYFPNGQALDSEKFVYKMQWLDDLHSWLTQLHSEKPLILLGDFNITFDARDVYDPATCEGQIHCSVQERDKLAKLISLGLFDSFRHFESNDKHYSWWDYRQGAFRRNAGLRIDHILVDERLKERVANCVIDKNPRRWEQPSDHAPVIMELNI